MLVLTRKLSESIFIGDSEVVVVGISGNKVKLGIVAPREVHIRRSELAIVNQDGDQQGDSTPVG